MLFDIGNAARSLQDAVFACRITSSNAIGLLNAPLKYWGSATPPPRPLPVASGSSPCLLAAGY